MMLEAMAEPPPAIATVTILIKRCLDSISDKFERIDCIVEL